MADATTNPSLILERLPGRYAVCRLDSADTVPSWAQAAADRISGGAVAGRFEATLLSITRTDRELSIVLDESLIPADVDASIKVQRGFVALRIAGTLDFSEVGILAKLTTALANAKVPVFVISTFETDTLLVHADYSAEAVGALTPVASVQSPPYHQGDGVDSGINRIVGR